MTRASENQAKERLRARGLRVTAPRVALLDFLATSREHPTLEDVAGAVNSRAQRVSRASVYNVLKTLCGAGLVSEFVVADGATRYDGNVDPHHHFVCHACGLVEDIPFQALSRSEAWFPGGHRVESHEFVLRGTCRDCQQAQATSGAVVSRRSENGTQSRRAGPR